MINKNKTIKCYMLIICAMCGLLFLTQPDAYAKTNKANIEKLEYVLKYIKTHYVSEIDQDELIDHAIKGMLQALDPYSEYYNGAELDFFVQEINAEFSGIGVELIRYKDAILIISPIDDLPASKAGIIPGDLIIGVNGKAVHELGFKAALMEIRGAPKTKVDLLIKSPDGKIRKIEIIRAPIKICPVKYSIEKDSNIAYIRISVFNASLFTEFKKTIAKIENQFKKNDTKLGGLIIDLRSNPGGLFSEAISLSEYFLQSGDLIVSVKDNKMLEKTISANTLIRKAPNVPVVILINEGTASSSEIVAGALKCHKRAIILGTQSFGKGVIQTLGKLRDQSALKITTHKYYTPDGESIDKVGITPDIYIEDAKVQYNEDTDKKTHIVHSYFKNNEIEESKNSKSDKNKIINKKKSSVTKKVNQSQTTDIVKRSNAKDKLTQSRDRALKETAKSKNEPNKADNSKNIKPKYILSDRYKNDYQYARAYDLLRGILLHNSIK